MGVQLQTDDAMTSSIKSLFKWLSTATLAFALGACGGGGGDPGAPILANPPSIQMISASGNAVLPNQTIVLVARATDSSGAPLANTTVNFAIVSNGTNGTLSASSATTNSNGVAQVLYTAGPQQGTDIINATVTGAQSKSATASVTLQVGVNPYAGPQIAISLQSNLAPGQTAVAPNSTAQITATVTSNGQPVVNQPVSFSFGLASSGGTGSASGPTLNGATGTAVQAMTNALGQATVTYVAGPQAGVDSIIATYSQNKIVMGIGSITISVQPSASPTWQISLMGAPSSGSCSQQVNVYGAGLICGGLTHNGISNSGVQFSSNGVALQARVTDRSGNPVPNAVVLFSLGSVSTSTGLPYCTPPAQLTGGVCHTTPSGSGPATPDTVPSIGNVNAGFASGTSTVVPSITAVTDANGVATARYVTGGATGTDIVLVTAGYNTGSAGAPTLGSPQGSQSATMNVTN